MKMVHGSRMSSKGKTKSALKNLNKTSSNPVYQDVKTAPRPNSIRSNNKLKNGR